MLTLKEFLRLGCVFHPRTAFCLASSVCGFGDFDLLSGLLGLLVPSLRGRPLTNSGYGVISAAGGQRHALISWWTSSWGIALVAGGLHWRTTVCWLPATAEMLMALVRARCTLSSPWSEWSSETLGLWVGGIWVYAEPCSPLLERMLIIYAGG